MLLLLYELFQLYNLVDCIIEQCDFFLNVQSLALILFWTKTYPFDWKLCFLSMYVFKKASEVIFIPKWYQTLKFTTWRFLKFVTKYNFPFQEYLFLMDGMKIVILLKCQKIKNAEKWKNTDGHCVKEVHVKQTHGKKQMDT